MSKHKDLMNKMLRRVGFSVALVVAVGGVYAGLSFYGDSVAQQKADADKKFNSEDALLRNFRKQIEQSTDAENRYFSIVERKKNLDFSINEKDLLALMAKASDRLHLSKAEVSSIPKEVASTKQDLSNFTHDVFLSAPITVEFEAISDLHVFSFIDELMRNAPGFIRIDGVELKRKAGADLSDVEFSAIRNGTGVPLLVSVKITFTWIGLKEKKSNAGGTSEKPGAKE